MDRHRRDVVARVVRDAEQRDRDVRDVPAGEDELEVVDDRLVVARQRLARHQVVLGRAVLVEELRPDREELHDLAGVVLVRVGLCARGHVQVRAHRRVERDLFEDVPVVPEGVRREDVEVRRELARPRDHVGRCDVDLLQREEHTLPELIAVVQGIREERRVQRPRRVVEAIAVDVARARLGVGDHLDRRVERRRGGVLRREPRQIAGAEKAADLGVLRAPGRLLEESGRLVAVESLREEDRHLPAGDRVVGAVARPAAAGRHDEAGELLDPRRQRHRDRDVGEDAHRRRRRVAGAVVDLQEKRRHLRAGDRRGRAVAQGIRRAAARHALGVELLDPVRREVAGGDVREHRPRRRRRHVRRAVARAEQEHRHLRACHRRGGAVVAAPAAGRDPVPDDRLDGA